MTTTLTAETLRTERNRTAELVYDAMPQDYTPDGAVADDWTAVGDLVAALSGLTESQIRKQLRRLEDADLAQRWNDDTAEKKSRTLWRAIRIDDAPAPPVEPLTTVDADDNDITLVPAESAVDVSDEPGADDATPAPAPLASGELDAVLGYMERVRPVSAPPVDVPAAKNVGACTVCGNPVVKQGRSVRHEFDDAALDHKATTRKQREPRPAREPKAKGETTYAVFGRGELRGAVLDYLRKNDGDHKPTAVAHAMNAQVGSVAFAMDKLVERGEASLIGERPRTYRAA